MTRWPRYCIRWHDDDPCMVAYQRPRPGFYIHHTRSGRINRLGDYGCFASIADACNALWQSFHA